MLIFENQKNTSKKGTYITHNTEATTAKWIIGIYVNMTDKFVNLQILKQYQNSIYPPLRYLCEKEQKKQKLTYRDWAAGYTEESDSLLHTNFAKSTMQISASEKFQATFRYS